MNLADDIKISDAVIARRFKAKMGREGFGSKFQQRSSGHTIICTHIDDAWSTDGNITVKTQLHSQMGQMSHFYDVRDSKIIRDINLLLTKFTEPEQRQKALEAARLDEMSAEIKEKFKRIVRDR